MKMSIAHHLSMLDKKCKFIIAILSILVISFLLISLFLTYLSRNENITCSTNAEIHNKKLKFSGSIIFELGTNYGTVTVMGKLYNDNIFQSIVSRRIRVNLERNDNTIILTSGNVAKDPGDLLTPQESRSILPAFTSSTGLSSTYDFYRQLNGNIMIMRGTIPIFFCNK